MKIQDFVVLDLETTGLSVKEDQILEIGAVKVQGGEVTASYETFVNPGRKVPERITELTGIRDEMIANAPDVETAVRGFLDFCGGLPLLGHNILFDYSFIKQAAINARLDFEKEAWDTLKIARKALPDLESRSTLRLLSDPAGTRTPCNGRCAGNAGTVPKTGRKIFGRSPGMVCRSASEGQNETRGSGDGGAEKISGGPDPVP